MPAFTTITLNGAGSGFNAEGSVTDNLAFPGTAVDDDDNIVAARLQQAGILASGSLNGRGNPR